jgi:HEAT repeat protein
MWLHSAPILLVSSVCRTGWRRVAQLLLLVMVVAIAAPSSAAQDVATLRKDLATATDFRVRVAAALALGKKKDTGSIDVISKALTDESAAVRSAAATALGAIGDSRALAALERAKGAEKDDGVKKSIDRAIGALRGKAKVIVALGKLENKTGNAKVSSHFQAAAKAELAKIPGVQVATSDNDAVEKAKAMKLPTIALDGRLVQLQKEKAGSDVGFQARVEFVIRKIPEQSLKASVKGNAKALLDARAVKGDKELSQLQADAVTAAVQSALSGSSKAMEEAAK